MKIPLLSILIICIGSLRLFGASATWTGTAELNSTPTGPGTNITLAGTFTNSLTILTSGTPANPITYTFAPGANFTKELFPSTGAIVMSGRSNIVIDGGINGLIQNTDNGTTNNNWSNSKGIAGTGLRDVIIKNLRITNIYRKVMSVFLEGYPSGVKTTQNAPFLTNEAAFCTTTAINMVSPTAEYQQTNAIAITNGSVLNFEQVKFGGTAVPGGLTAGVWYWVVTTWGAQRAPLGLKTNTFQVALTQLGTPIILTSTGTDVTITSRILDENRNGYPITVDGSSITISNCMVSDGDGGIVYSASAATQADVFLINNKLLDCNHTFSIGVAEPNTYMTNLVIAGNYMDHWDTWDAPGDTQVHLDGIIIFNNTFSPSGICRHFRIYNNYFGPHVGTRTTGAIFDSTYNFGIWDYFVYNNLFECQRSNSWGNGFVSIQGSNGWVFNNTAIGVVTNTENWGGGFGVNGTNMYAYNNILASGSGITLTASYFGPSNDLSSLSGSNRIHALSNYCGGVWSDYNVFNGHETMNFAVSIWKTNYADIWLSGILNTFQKWQTFISNTHGWPEPYWNQTHADPNSTTNLPSFNSGTYVPSIGDTVARGKGTNLTALLPNDPTMLSDRTGFPRSSSGNWTIGAFESLGQSASIAQGKFKRRGAR